MQAARDHSPRPSLGELAAIFAGGVLGALARAGLNEALPPSPGAWPWATFAVNLPGALLLGWAVVRLPAASRSRPFVTAGFCGALTTFSTLQLELLELFEDGHAALALAYLAATLAGGLAAVAAGTRLARRSA